MGLTQVWVATAGDEMQIMVAVITMQALGHPIRVDMGTLVWRDLGLSLIVMNPLIRKNRE
jgi:hypothetical protein